MPTTPDQLLEQATRHAAHLERLKSGEVKKLRLLLASMEDELIGRLSRQNVTDWSRTRMERQLKVFSKLVRERYADRILPELNRSLSDLSEFEAGFEQRSLANVAEFNFELPSKSQVLSAVRTTPLSVKGPSEGMLLKEFLSGWTNGEVRRVQQVVRAGFAQGDTTPQIVRRMREQVAGQSTRALEAVARTGLQHAAATAREATWEANKDIVKRVRWVSTLDSKTSTQCRSLDGTVFPVNEGPRPPIHVNCRSTTVAALDDRFKFLEEGGTRRTRNPETGEVGSTSSEETYYGFLKRQSAATQDSIIGPTRGRLLRNGGLTSERFAELQLDKRFEPITLEEMRQLEPLAFEKAGL